METHEFSAMNTGIILQAEGRLARVWRGFQAAESLIHALEQRFTRFSEASELSALNRSAGAWFAASPELFAVLRLAAELHRQTDGLFNPGILAALERAGYDHSMEEIRQRSFPELVEGRELRPPSLSRGVSESLAQGPRHARPTASSFPEPVEPEACAAGRVNISGEKESLAQGPRHARPAGGSFPEPVEPEACAAGRVNISAQGPRQARPAGGSLPEPVEPEACAAGRVNISAQGPRRARPAGFDQVELDEANRAVRLPAGLTIDLGGIAKGWIAERAARRLALYAPACGVDAGGDIFLCGAPDVGLEGDAAWSISIEDPFHPGRDLAVFSVPSGAVATSSVIKRAWRQGGQPRHHLIDPRSGQPAETPWASVTVFAPHAAQAEVLAKALLIAGPQGADALIRRHPGAAFVVVDRDGGLFASENARKYRYEYTR